jgi:arylsulfatase A-like enzyme
MCPGIRHYRYYHPGHHNVAAHYGVRANRYKLIYFNKLNQRELYDLLKDPIEMRNLYSDPAYAGLANKLKAELK